MPDSSGEATARQFIRVMLGSQGALPTPDMPAPSAQTPPAALPPLPQRRTGPATPAGPYLYQPGRRKRATTKATKKRGPRKPKVVAAAPPEEPGNDDVAWIRAAHSAMPENKRDRLLRVIAWAIGVDHDTELCSQFLLAPECSGMPHDQWLRALFARTPPQRRKAVAKDLAVMTHPDNGGSEDLFVAIQSIAKRFGAAK